MWPQSSDKLRKVTLLCLRKFLKTIFSMHETGGSVTRFSVVKNNFKIEGRNGDWNSCLPHQKTGFLPFVPWERTGFLTNVSDITKNWHDRDSNPHLPLQKHVVPHCAMGTIGMEMLIDASEIIKFPEMAEIRNHSHFFRNLFSEPQCCHFF